MRFAFRVEVRPAFSTTNVYCKAGRSALVHHASYWLELLTASQGVLESLLER